MTDRLTDLLANLFSFDVTADLLQRDFVQHALLAAALALVWCVTIIAGLYPARVAGRIQPADVIHEE